MVLPPVIGSRFKVQREIGRGGMGAVFLVEEEGRAEPIALKVLVTRDYSEPALRHFEQEFRTLTSLSHPNLVEVYDFGRVTLPQDGRTVPFFTMEFVRGQTIDRRFAEGALEVGDLGLCLAQVGQALAYLHARGWVHQDVKPSNIMVTTGADGAPLVKLMDLGLASRPREGPGAGGIRGTVAYLSPEAARGEAVDPRSDLYALGCVAYELVTGRPPFVAPDAMGVLRGHLTEPPIPPSKLNRALGEPMDHLILRLLAKDPGSRPANADRFLELLNNAVGGGLAIGTPEALRHRVLGGGFVGREREVARLLGYLEAARQAGAPVVLLVGEAGVGKSRLLREFQVRCQIQGDDVYLGRASLAEALGRAVRARGPLSPAFVDRHGKSLDRLLGTGADDAATSEPVSLDPVQVVSEAVEELARAQPLVLAIDDLQLADETTCLVLQELARHHPASGLLLVGAYRGDEVTPSSPLSELLVDGRERSVVEELFVEPLSPSDTASLLRSMMGAEEVPAPFVDRLHEETRGNPLHLGELVALLTEQGLVRPGSGEPADPAVLVGLRLPGRMRDLAEIRLARVAPEPRRVLEAAAILGRTMLDPDAVAVVAELRWDTGTRHLDDLVASGLLVREEDEGGAPVYRFAHRGLGDMVQQATPVNRARALHERALAYLKRRGVPRRHAAWVDVARHAEAAGSPGRAIEAFSRAADLAREIHAHREAVRLYGSAIDLVHRRPDVSAPLLCDLHRNRGEILALGGDLEHAEQDARAMLAAADAAGHEALRARACLMLGEVLASRSVDDDAEESLGRALEIARRLGDADLASRAATALGRLASTQGRNDVGARRFDEASGIARAAGLVEREVEAIVGKGVALRDQGDMRASLGCFEKAAALGTRRPSPGVEIAILEGSALALEVQGRYPDAAATYERARDTARARGDAVAAAALTTSLGAARLKTGDYDGARGCFEEALEVGRRLGMREVVVRSVQNVAELALYQGRHEAALESAEEAVRQSRTTVRRDLQATSLNLVGRIHLRAGDLERAGACLDEAQQIMRDIRNERWLAVFLLDLAEHARLKGDSGETRRLAQESAFLARKVGDRRVEAVAMTRLGEAHLEENDYDRAVVAAKKATSLVERSGLPREEAAAALLRARIALTRPGGDVVRAEMDALAALDRYGELQEPESTWQAEHLAGRAALRLGRREEAASRVDRAHRHLEDQRSRLPSRWRETFLADPRRAEVYEDWQRLRPSLARDAERPPSEPLASSGEFSRLQSENTALRRLLDINRALASTRDADELLPVILDAAVELTGAERGFVLLRDGAELATRSARAADGSPLEGDALTVSRSVARRTIDEGTPLLSTDAETDERLSRAQSIHDLRIRSVLAVPLTLRDEVVGAIYLDNRLDRGVFTPAHQELASRLAEQAAITLDTARLLAHIDEQRASLDRLNRELERTAAAQRAELAEVREILVSTRSNLELRFRFEEMVGGSQAMQRVYHLVERLAPKRLAVLIVGESGTGKELIARALHSKSDRSGGPFFTVNCAALPEQLLESELFGFRKGAFTGADRNKPGYFELAHGGTLFLDEIGEMDLAMQAKLLRVLQEGEFLPVGGSAPMKVDVRVVSATNKDLSTLIAEKTFREDLYYRIHAARIDVPPLRQRREDIPLLVDHFLGQIAAHEGEPKKEVDPAALQRWVDAPWPGNVRELQHQIMRVCAFARGSTLTLRDLERYGDLRGHPPDTGPRRSAPVIADKSVASLEETERRQIQLALERAGGNKTRAAEILGINRATLFRKLKRLDHEG